ncbi:26S proteasome non-ATPase regulatory subunit 2-like protein A, partial [Bienertia sinuspersici]
MANAPRTMKELAAPTFDPNLLCMTYVDNETECEIKPGLIKALPTFTGFRDTSSSSSSYMTDPNNRATPPGFAQPQIQYQPRPPQCQQAQVQQQPQSGGIGLKNSENQVSQLADTLGKLQAQNSNKLLSQLEKNPRENPSVISLRSGKGLEGPSIKSQEQPLNEQEEEETI